MVNRWTEKLVQDYALLVTKGTTPTSIGLDFTDSGITFVKIESIVNNMINKNMCAFISSDTNLALSRSILKENDILVSIAGALGRCAKVGKDILPANTNQALAIVRLDDRNICIDYVFKYFQSEMIYKQIVEISVQGAQANLSLKNIKFLVICLPVDINEQRRIASVLYDIDNLISLLEKIIAKKRAIKQGIMQKLLTGRRRLPGFRGEWIDTVLEQLSDIIKGKGLSKSKVSANGRYFCILYGELFTKYTEIIHSIVSKTDYEEGILSKKGDILIPGSTTTTGIDLARASAIPFDEVLIGGDVNIIRPRNNNVDSAFLALYITNTRQQEIAIRAKGITVYHLHGKDLLDLPLRIPNDKDEQIAIASILSDMDAELDILTAKLNKLRNIKQGMMSELLTGRIRLPEQKIETALEKNETQKIKKMPKQTAKKIASKTSGHNQQFDDAVMIAGIVNVLYSDKYPLGRKKVQKCLYLLRRHQDESTAAFKKKAAGPYADEVRYKGGEPIAMRNGYIKTQKGNQGTRFAVGEKVSQALGYIENWGKQADIQWVEDKLKYIGIEKLELLATVDMAICDLTEAGTPVSVVAIKDLIANNAEWKAKLKKQTFSDDNIADAINELQILLQGENRP
jgi:type I restriction enzyme, S subunit